ncbi:protein KIAA0100 [Galendromus occidentalis]|uniref:Protein KIAA0100 n=1 Tax=Galendromus occidentalis TaxID=34638 RepID=A0AAJ7SEZ0_9ACAR|nr:protein KIAA0100 [Galendromus occidentalis]
MLLASLIFLVGLAVFAAATGTVIYRLILFLITRYIQRKLNVKVRIGRLKFFKFFFIQDLYVQLENGTVLQAERMWVSSCIFSNDYSSLVAVCFSDVRLQLNFDSLLEESENPEDDRESHDSNSVNNQDSQGKLPSNIITALKNISLHLYNVDIMQLDGGNDSLVHTTFKELTLFAYAKNKESCSINFSVKSAALRIFKQPDKKRDTCLANAYVDAECRLSILLGSPFLLKSLEVDIRNPVLTISENLQIHKIFRQASPTRRSSEPADDSKRARLRRHMLRLPRKVNFSLSSLSFKVMKENWMPGLSFELDQLTSSLCNDSGAVCNIVLKDASFSSEATRMASLALVEMETTLENYCDLSVALKVQSFYANYNKDEMHYWVGWATAQRTEQLAKGGQDPHSVNPTKTEWKEDDFLLRTVNVSLQVCDLMTSLKPGEAQVKAPKLNAGVSRFTVELDLQRDLSGRWETNAEVMMATGVCAIGSFPSIQASTLKKFHAWKMPLAFGMCVVQVKDSAKKFQLEGSTNDIHIETTPALLELLQILRQKEKETSKRDVELDPPRDTKKKTRIDLTFTNANIFAANSVNHYVALRMDTLKIAADKISIKCLAEESSLKVVENEGPYYQVLPAKLMANRNAYVKTMIFRWKAEEISLEFAELSRLWWTTTAYLHVITLINDTRSILRNGAAPSDSAAPREKSRTTIPAFQNFKLAFRGDSVLEFRLSAKHSMYFIGNDFVWKRRPNEAKISSDKLICRFDEHEIFTFEKIEYALNSISEESRVLRKHFRDSGALEQEENRRWQLSFGHIGIDFPHDYNFAEAFSEDFISCFKWMKLVHGKKKSPFTSESPLPADLTIRAKSITLEIQDDPFEVKLRQNYQLLEDEYFESCKRRHALDLKIDEFRKSNLLMTEATIGELYQALDKMNVDQYIKRSRQLYESSRQSLIRWVLSDLEFSAMADPSFHGMEKCVALIKQLNPNSPLPEDTEFATLWCRVVSGSCQSIECSLRDFPKKFVEVDDFYWFGKLVGAEQEGTARAKRTCIVELNAPFENRIIERNMPPLKFFYDMTFDLNTYTWVYGSCWEPILAQVNLALDLINKPSTDPSPPLPWWDKARLLTHGKLTVSGHRLSYLQHASLNPYNCTEMLDTTWTNAMVYWHNGRIICQGNLDQMIYTASRYHASHLLHFPNLKLSVKLTWRCLANPFDHHSMMPCATDKLPEYSIHQRHDSYRAFRSTSVDMSVSLETRTAANGTDGEDDPNDTPRLLLYSATIRWLENFKSIVAGLAKLTRRGKLFGNTRPRKTQLSKHFHNVTLTISLHRFQVSCWTSLAKHDGFELDSGRFQLSCEHNLTMLAVRNDFNQMSGPIVFLFDNIRQKPSWSTVYMNCELSDCSHIWLYHMDEGNEEALKRYFLSVACVSYGRETKLHNVPESLADETPLHRLAVHGLKGAWTKHNRDVVFGLFDTFINAVNLRRNMTNEALKPFKMEQANKSGRKVSSPSTTPNLGGSSMANASANRSSSSKAFSMLEKLIAESVDHNLVFTESVDTPEPVNLTGVKECQLDDVLCHNWLIELRNSQVMLRGCDSPGYVILSAAKAQILQRIHTPVWKDNNLVPKTTWKGTLDCMQYYATVENVGSTEDDVQWLTTENIEARETDITDYADIVGSGHSVGGVVSADVGGGEGGEERKAQLQRIISRCGCQFFYASFGEQGIDPATLEEVPPLPDEKDPDDPWEHEVAVDSFTLIHHDLQVCTNPLQYSMILDLVNNLLLYVEPRRKEANERLQRMRFELQLEQDKDQRGPIISLQNKARELIALHKELEKKAFATQRRLETSPEDEELIERLAMLEQEILVKKKQLHLTSEDLTLMVNCYRETQVAAWKSQRQLLEHTKISTVRRSEVSFKHALWKLTDEDGQLGIAEIVLSNFLYSRTTKSTDSVEHLLELGNMKVTNETPTDVYRDVLQPTEAPSHVPVERQRALRIFCRVRAPVGGISVKEHLEVNIVPISICLTSALSRKLLTFFFSRKEAEKAVDGDDVPVQPKENPRKKDRRRGDRNPVGHDDIEKMKERAANNQTFLYIKIPEVPMRLTYKSEKEKKDLIRDLIDYSLVLPTIELHNKTCTWLDLLIIIKINARQSLLSQAIRQKLLIKSTTTTTASISLAESASGNGGKPEVKSEVSDEQRRILLFGNRVQPETKKEKRLFFK